MGKPLKFPFTCGTWKTEVGPMLGSNLYLSHLLPGPINPWTIQAVYTGITLTEIKHYLCGNAGQCPTGRR